MIRLIKANGIKKEQISKIETAEESERIYSRIIIVLKEPLPQP